MSQLCRRHGRHTGVLCPVCKKLDIERERVAREAADPELLRGNTIISIDIETKGS